jgi:hypothetical protein
MYRVLQVFSSCIVLKVSNEARYDERNLKQGMSEVAFWVSLSVGCWLLVKNTF